MKKWLLFTTIVGIPLLLLEFTNIGIGVISPKVSYALRYFVFAHDGLGRRLVTLSATLFFVGLLIILALSVIRWGWIKGVFFGSLFGIIYTIGDLLIIKLGVLQTFPFVCDEGWCLIQSLLLGFLLVVLFCISGVVLLIQRLLISRRTKNQ